jgi:glycosyltransferase involved in cell wall biosynthesis
MDHSILPKKNIIVVTTLFDHGGIATYWQSIARETAHEYNFIVYSNLVKDLDPDPFKLPNVQVIPKLVWKSPIESCKILWNLVTEFQPESVFFNGTLVKFKLLPAIILMRIFFVKIRLCTIFHSSALYQSQLKNNINLVVVKFATFFIPRRIFVSRAVEKYWAIAGETITRPFLANVKANQIPKSKDDSIKIGYLGRLSAEKDPHMLASAVRIARATLSHIKVEFAGLGSLRESLAAEYPEYSYIGWVSPSDWLPYIDLLVNSSKTEGWPLSVVEAIENGVPVIAFDVGGNGEVLEAVKNLAIVSKRTEEALAQKIVQFVQNYNENYEEYFKQLMAQKKDSLSDWSKRILQSPNQQM